MLSPWLLSLDEQAVDVMLSDPEPDILLPVFEGQSAIFERDAGGPDLFPRTDADFFELERAMVRIVFEQGELLIGSTADIGGQSPVVLPEGGVRLVDHL